MLHLNTIDPALYKVLQDLCRLPELSNFALVGGTSLSLQIGHRRSDDLDFFTDRSFDIIELKYAVLCYSLEDIAAFKLDAICHRKEKKDYIDIALLLEKFSFEQMLEFYKEKFPMNDKRIVLTQILDIDGWENSVEPVMLTDLSPKKAFEQIKEKVNVFSTEQIKAKDEKDAERIKKITELLNRKNKDNKGGH